MDSFYTRQELEKMGFKQLGESVKISRNASFYGVENISVGDNVRIDDFSIISGKIKLGNYIHIAAHCALYGSLEIEMEDYTGLSPRCTVFSAMDDFSGDFLIGPTVDSELTRVSGGKVVIKRYSQIGAGCVVFPNLIVEEGVVVGAMSLVNKTLKEWGIYAGIPVKRIKERKKGLLQLIKK